MILRKYTPGTYGNVTECICPWVNGMMEKGERERHLRFPAFFSILEPN